MYIDCRKKSFYELLYVYPFFLVEMENRNTFYHKENLHTDFSFYNRKDEISL